MAEITNRKINIYIETGAAQTAFDRLNNKAEALQKAIASTTDKGEIKKLQKDLDALSHPLDVARKKLSGEMAPSIRELKSLVNDLGNRMQRMSTSDADFSKVLAQYTEAKQRLGQVTAEVKKVEQAHHQSGSAFGSFVGNLAAQGVAKVVDIVTEMGMKSMKWALETEGVEKAYRKLNNPNLLADLRKATNGTVNDLELMKRAVSAKNFQIPLESLGSMMEFAKRRANETGQSVDYLVDSIVTGIGRKSPLILDNLGLSASRLSEEFKKTGDFGKAAFNVVQQELENMGPVIETNQDKVDRWVATWDNAWTHLAGGAIGTVDFISSTFVNGMRTMFDTDNLAREQAIAANSKQLAAAYDFELKTIEDYKTRFSGADKDGRAQIIKNVEQEIATTTALRDQAQRDGLAQKAGEFDRYLKQWSGFLHQLKTQNPGGDTLAGMDAELKLLNESLQNATVGSKQFLDTQKKIKDLEKQKDAALGKTQEKTENKAAKDAANQRKRDNDKIKSDQTKLAEDLRKIRLDLSLFDVSEKDKEVARSFERYEQLRKQAHGNKELLKQIDEAYQREYIQILVKWGRKETEEFEKKDKARRTAEENFINKNIEAAQDRAIKMGEALQAGQLATQDRNNRSAIAGLELDILKAHGRKKLEAEKALLTEQKNQELQNKDLTEAEKALIEARYKKQSRDLEREHWQQVAGMVMEFVGTALQVLDQFGQLKTAQENAELERDKKVNDRKKGNLDKQLKNKQISQSEYDRQVDAIEKAQEKKEHQAQMRQFRRGQRMAVAQALIGGAQAAQKTLAEWGMPLAIPWLALTAASTIAQIATINAQKPPEFAQGGLLSGPSHQSRWNGMPVTNPQTGQVQAYMEGGEGITNKRTMADGSAYTVSGTPSQIISRLNGLHGGVQWAGGATLRPAWKTAPQRMDFNTLNQASRTVRMFADGGTFQTTPTTGGDGNQETMVLLAGVLNQLQNTLAGGIPAVMSLNHFETQVERKARIDKERTLK
jgi:hypothetical protein